MSELERDVGFDECNRLVVGLMRNALVAQAEANEARQLADLQAKKASRLANLHGLVDDLSAGDGGESGERGQLTFHKSAEGDT